MFCCKAIQWNVFPIKLFNVNMIVRINGLVFLFIIRIRFPRGKSVAIQSETDIVQISEMSFRSKIFVGL